MEVEIRQHDDQLEALVEDAAPHLIALHGAGSETGGALLVAIGDNADRLHSEAPLAHCVEPSLLPHRPDGNNDIV